MQSEFITVGTYSTSVEAYAAKNFLESNGIRAFITDEHSSTEGWWNALETKIQVLAGDAMLAREHLSKGNCKL